MIIAKVILTTTLCFLSFTGGKSIKIEKVAEPVEFGEGPYWDVRSQKLYYVDVLKGHRIVRYDPVTGRKTYATLDAEYVSVVAPVEGTADKHIAGVDRNVVVVTWDGEHDVNNPPTKKLASIDTDRNDTRANDGKCDAAGRFWIGTMAIHKPNEKVKPNRGSLYRIGEDGRADTVVSPVSLGNGLTWSLKNDVMYYIDSPSYQIWAFDYDMDNGTLSNKRVIFDLKKNDVAGLPDGMTNDADGNLWFALFDGKAIMQIDPKNGKILRKIEMPVDIITSMAFGGPRLDVLYVTSSRSGLTARERQRKPDSGALYRITGLGVKGVAPFECKYNFPDRNSRADYA